MIDLINTDNERSLIDRMLISIIIPVFNAEKYLDECIESVVNQTYTELEIILLPGQSGDRSTEICHEWAGKDSRIKIVDQDKNCTGYARNKGIAFSNGEYVAFCDADDKMLPTYIEEMAGSAISNNSDIVECEYYDASEDLSQLTAYTIPELLSDFPHNFYECFGSSSVWRYIIKRNFWVDNGFKFPEANRMEDLAVYSLLFAKANNVSFVYKPLYLYRANPNSIMHTLSSINSVMDNYSYIADYITEEHRRYGVFENTKKTILNQLEYHAGFILDSCSGLTNEIHTGWEEKITNKLKSLFDCNLTSFEVKALGWGSKGTGILCNLLTKQCSADGRYTSNMTLRAMTNDSITAQLEAVILDYRPNVIVIDLLEEVDDILAHSDSIDTYLKQWILGVHSYSKALQKCCPSAHIFIIEKYLATKKLSDGIMEEFSNKDDLDILNELLRIMYQDLIKIIQDSIFISAIPEKSRYSTSDDSKSGHNYDETYYCLKIMDILHFIK